MKKQKSLLIGMLFCGLVSTLFAGTYGGGSGTAADPYKIASKAHLLELAATTADYNKYFILTANIDLTGETFTTAIIAPDTNSSSSGFQGTQFTGAFDGNGHTISNLIIAGTGKDYVGLFGYVGTGGQVKNLGVVNTNIQGRKYVGGLVGYNYGTITSCYATGSVSGTGTFVGGLAGYNYSSGTITSCYATGTVSGTDTYSYVGGLVGYNYGTITSCYATGSVSGTGTFVGGLAGKNSGTISSSYATGSISGNSFVGGLVGHNELGTLTSCYATGSVSGSKYVGGLVGRNFSSTITECYSTGAVSGNDTVGGLVGYNNGTITSCFWDTQTSGKNDGVGNQSPDPSGVTGKTTAEMKMLSTFTDAGWDFTDTDGDEADWVMPQDDYPYLAWESPGNLDYSGGSGRVYDPYQIATKADLLKLAATTSDYSKYFILTADIDLTGETFTTAVIAPDTNNSNDYFQGTQFTGMFDGNNHVISNLTIIGQDYLGLFGCIHAIGRVQNLQMNNCTISGRNYAGIVTGEIKGTLRNCRASAGTITGNLYLAGMAGYQSETVSLVEDCSAICTITGVYDVAGLVGNCQNGTIRRCWTEGTYKGTGSLSVGGLAAYNRGTIIDCHSKGQVIGNTWIGGLVGLNDGTINKSYATGAVSGADPVGGLCGENRNTISSSYATGTATGSGNNVGGLAGRHSAGTVSSCYATGSVSGGGWAAGGLIGWNNALVENCHATGNVQGSNSAGGYTGGLVGTNEYENARIINCYATGNVTGKWGIGGLVGLSSKPIISSYAAGTVTSPGDFAGGLVGRHYGTITSCYATGAVTGTYYVGGLVGGAETNSEISWSYASGTVSGSNISIGGLAGSNYYGKIYRCYATGTVGGGTGSVSGLVGQNWGTIESCHATGSVTAFTANVGGLVGCNREGAIISSCYASGKVTGYTRVGGLCGENYYGTINQSYATGMTTGDNGVGGLCGKNYKTIFACYATGAVTGSNGFIGGFVGRNEAGNIGYSYAVGRVNNGVSSAYVGGFCGVNDGGTITISCWDLSTSGQTTSFGGSGLTTAQMKALSTFTSAGWDISFPWDSWIGGKTGNALSFDGVNDYVDVTEYKGILGTQSRTCCAWIKTAAVQQGNIISWGAEQSGRRWSFRPEANGTLAVGVYGGQIYTTATVNDGQWHHVAAVLNNDGSPSVDEIRLYIDGILQSTTANSTQSVDTMASQDVAIGAFKNSGVPATYFNGLLDEVCIYGRALDASEIDPEAAMPTDGLVAHWAMDEAEGTVVHDSVSSYDGVLRNSNNSTVWSICEGTNYPRLQWQIPSCDWGCPDGVNTEDLNVLSGCWLETVQAGSDINHDDAVNLADFMMLAQQWLVSGCDSCDGADITGDGNVDESDLAAMAGQWLLRENSGCRMADLNNDGEINLADYAIFAQHWLEQ